MKIAPKVYRNLADRTARALASAGLALMLNITLSEAEDAVPAYKQLNLPVEKRVKDLLGRMTLEEKVRQLDMYFGCQDFLDTDQIVDRTHSEPDAVFNPEKAKKALGNLGVGSVHDLYPRPKLYNSLQAWVLKSNRLGIPAMFIEEGLHGYIGTEQTVFPQSVNLATTWNLDIARRTGAAIAAEARANGVHMILGPVLDIARDPRWGRVEEDFGEDPYLTGRLGLAVVQGMQGESLATDHTVIAEPKHFTAHGSPESGLNTSPVHMGEREVRSIMLKSFEPAFREGNAMGIMVAYHDIDGVPCTANPWLLNKVLRGEWGFQGFALSDLGAIKHLRDPHHVVGSDRDAICLAINSGVDMQFYDFPHEVFQEALIAGVKEGQISGEMLDLAVKRVLRAKFLLGLFDKPFVDESLEPRVRRCREHLDLALEAGRQSMCLLKNRNSVLPLKKDIKRIAVIGPNANTTRYGDYSDGSKENSEEGMLEQIKKIVFTNTLVVYSDGANIDEALEKTKQADVVILALGEKMGISGEGFDRLDLGLPDSQEALLEAVEGTGVPVVLVLQNGRALAMPWAVDHVPAILEAWYPGQFGGQAIAETLFGDNNPAGRLPVSFPRRVGQLPIYYNHFPSKGTKYVDGNDSPQFVFGYGLSYTIFKYDRLKVTSPSQESDDVLVCFEVANTGCRDGDEVAQLYIRKTTSSVATPVKALKGFRRIHLDPGEVKTVTLRLKQSELAVWNANQEWKVEPGEYVATVGGNSAEGVSNKFCLQ